ncbi:hypothetical protein [Kiloniella laminariae]|uniref:hypothetical protein n=1 Tax=Kiloniella laminariae TaxID=454162 RepID=UPI0003644F24|nr:hypothetical protein [Kiloniella laminariae]
MFGIPSLGKLLVLGIVIAGVYLVFKTIGRRGQSPTSGSGGSDKNRQSSQKNQDISGSLDMIQCPACHAYIPAKSKCSCGGAG